MLEFMRNGGASMWAILVAAIATGVVAAVRAPRSRAATLAGGSVLSLILGVLGMSLGLVAVASHYDRFPDKVAAIAEGLSELANNGIFGAAIAIVLGVAAIVASRRQAAAQ